MTKYDQFVPVLPIMTNFGKVYHEPRIAYNGPIYSNMCHVSRKKSKNDL